MNEQQARDLSLTLNRTTSKTYKFFYKAIEAKSDSGWVVAQYTKEELTLGRDSNFVCVYAVNPP